VKVLIVDDEKLARERLARLVSELDGYEVAGEAENGIEALKAVQKKQPDIVLMDIRMPGMDGLEAARHLAEFKGSPAVIFCTAYSEYAVEAFDAQAVGYLLKPVRSEMLAEVLKKAHRLNRVQLHALQKNEPSSTKGRTHISARTRRGLELIPIDDVRFFVADHKYVTVRHREGELLIDDTLKDLEKEFGNRFVRIHRNALVSLSHIQSLERNNQGQSFIAVADINERLAVSRRHVMALKKLMESL
jgi:two-component system response regulator AlgR